jgi:hypothetical protein
MFQVDNGMVHIWKPSLGVVLGEKSMVVAQWN